MIIIKIVDNQIKKNNGNAKNGNGHIIVLFILYIFMLCRINLNIAKYLKTVI